MRLGVTGTNAFGSASAESPPTALVGTAAVQLTFDGTAGDPGCGGCTVAFDPLGLRASIDGGADNVDTAYGLMDFGGDTGLSGLTYVRSIVRLAQGQVLTANLAIIQVRDTADSLLYELYVTRDRTLGLWSPAGGLRPTALSVNTGVVVPNGVTSGLRVEVAAARYDTVTVRVDGVDRISLPAYAGTTGSGQRYLRAGIDHYDSASGNERVTVHHSHVAVGSAGWFGVPGDAPAAPVSVSPPALTGTPQLGQLLQATTGSWSGNPSSYAYHWLRCGADGGGCVLIGGAAASAYTLTVEDIGSTLRAQVVAVNEVGSSAPAVSDPSGIVLGPQPPENTAAPVLSGGAREGETVAASAGVWTGDPASFGYQWLRCDEAGSACAAIDGASGSVYGLAAADVGRRIRVEVTARNGAGSGTAQSAPSALVAPALSAPVVVSLPALSGEVEQGRRLSASAGQWSGSPTGFAYQWRRCDPVGAGCVDLPGGVEPSYDLAAADVGRTVRVRVTASNADGSGVAESEPSAVVAAVAAVNLAPNPGFESDPAGSYFTHGTAVFSWAGDAPFSGSRSLKIVSSATTLSRWLSVPRLITAVRGQSYTVSAWLHTLLAKEATVALNFWSSAGVHLGTSTSTLKLVGSQPFTQVSLRATAPAGTASLRVEFRLNGKGTLWVDDVTVTAS